MNESTVPPLISVIIPTYNRETLLKRAIASILHQTVNNFEIIIVDDCSQDDTENTVQKIKNIEPRIQYFRHKTNHGAQTARNTGIKAAKGEWIAFLDSDDEWLPERLEKGLERAYSEDVSIVYSECYKKVGDGGPLEKFNIPNLSGRIYKELLSSPGPMFQGLLIKKECLEHINYLDENIVSYQEWDTSIRLAEFYSFAFIEEPLFIYHYHEGETISKDMQRDADGWRQIVEKHRPEILSHAGQNALAHHYLTLSGKYFSIGDTDLGFSFKSMAFKMFSHPYRCKWYVYNLLQSNSMVRQLYRKLISLRKKIITRKL